MRSTVGLSATLVVLAACAQGPQPDLALACQTTKCTCMPEGAGLLVKGTPVPVEWKTNGDAFCPVGYTLRRDEKKK